MRFQHLDHHNVNNSIYDLAHVRSIYIAIQLRKWSAQAAFDSLSIESNISIWCVIE